MGERKLKASFWGFWPNERKVDGMPKSVYCSMRSGSGVKVDAFRLSDGLLFSLPEVPAFCLPCTAKEISEYLGKACLIGTDAYRTSVFFLIQSNPSLFESVTDASRIGPGTRTVRTVKPKRPEERPVPVKRIGRPPGSIRLPKRFGIVVPKSEPGRPVSVTAARVSSGPDKPARGVESSENGKTKNTCPDMSSPVSAGDSVTTVREGIVKLNRRIRQIEVSLDNRFLNRGKKATALEEHAKLKNLLQEKERALAILLSGRNPNVIPDDIAEIPIQETREAKNVDPVPVPDIAAPSEVSIATESVVIPFPFEAEHAVVIDVDADPEKEWIYGIEDDPLVLLQIEMIFVLTELDHLMARFVSRYRYGDGDVSKMTKSIERFGELNGRKREIREFLRGGLDQMKILFPSVSPRLKM